MPKTNDEIIKWKGLGGGDALTHVQLFDDMVFQGRQILILTEPENNPGTSVTNAIEKLAAFVCPRLKINPANVTIVEHYPEGDGRRGIPESFDIVTFNSAIFAFEKPVWYRVDWSVIREHIAPDDPGIAWADL